MSSWKGSPRGSRVLRHEPRMENVLRVARLRDEPTHALEEYQRQREQMLGSCEGASVLLPQPLLSLWPVPFSSRSAHSSPVGPRFAGRPLDLLASYLRSAQLRCRRHSPT